MLEPLWVALLPRLTNQHRIAGRIAPGADESFSVARPGKSIHQAVFKLRDLFRLTTSDGLAPEVGDIVECRRVVDCGAVGRPLTYC